MSCLTNGALSRAGHSSAVVVTLICWKSVVQPMKSPSSFDGFQHSLTAEAFIRQRS
ncbi:MAG: hypothetical protein ACTS4Z_00270 [Candidatus Hodgkinia cicadicola]